MLILAAIQVLLAGAVALVGTFADGGDVISRAVLVGLHPIAAVALLVGLLAPATRRAVMGLLALSILADLGLAISIEAGAQQGDAWLPLLFAIIPAIGLAYFRFRHWPQGR